jgi:hypothetical protein
LIGAPGLVRSSAKTLFGYGVTMNIVLLATIGAASCPWSTPVEKAKATWRLPTFAPLISSSAEYRVAA